MTRIDYGWAPIRKLKRQQLEQAYEAAIETRDRALKKQAELKAAIEALHTPEVMSPRYTRCVHCQYPWPCDTIRLADNGAATLRERDEWVWNQGFSRGLRYTGDEPDLDILNPYRDTAGGES